LGKQHQKGMIHTRHWNDGERNGGGEKLTAGPLRSVNKTPQFGAPGPSTVGGYTHSAGKEKKRFEKRSQEGIRREYF